MSIKHWIIRKIDRAAAMDLSRQCNIKPFPALLLGGRGISEVEAVNKFMGAECPDSDPFLFADMDKAVERINRAVDCGERIAVYGDYDADGVTATAILYSYLCAAEADVIFYIPDRYDEGYGMNNAAVDRLKEQGVKLIVTVDNGIASVDEIAYAASLGIDVVVTDHHKPKETLPAAVAAVDPCRADCKSGLHTLSGAGVALKLVAALSGGFNEYVEELTDLCAIGTLGDMCPVTGENRDIIKLGIKRLQNSDRPGLLELMRACGIDDRRVTSEDLSYYIIPRINAAGRMGNASRVVRLLLTDDIEEGKGLSEELCADNERRKKLQNEVCESVFRLLEENPDMMYDRIPVFAGEGWHHGVVGIAAARMTELTGKPCVVIGIEGDEAAGSARSVGDFSIFDAISSCADILTRFGGHSLAAGVSLPKESIPEFRRRINEYAAKAAPIMPLPELAIDCKLNINKISVEMAREIDCLSPFGTDNQPPVFALMGMRLENISEMGGGKHLRLTFSREGGRLDAALFNTKLDEFAYNKGDTVDVAVNLSHGVFRGEDRLSVTVKDIRPASRDEAVMLPDIRCYEAIMRGDKISAENAAAASPTRAEAGEVYKFIHNRRGWRGGSDALACALSDKLSYVKTMVSLTAMEQMGLLQITRRGDVFTVSECKTNSKVNLFDSEILTHLKELAYENQCQ